MGNMVFNAVGFAIFVHILQRMGPLRSFFYLLGILLCGLSFIAWAFPPYDVWLIFTLPIGIPSLLFALFTRRSPPVRRQLAHRVRVEPYFTTYRR